MGSKKPSLPKISSDRLFKKIFESKIAAREFLTEYLPDDAKAIVDLNQKIALDKDSFIEPDLKSRFCDVLLKVKTKNQSRKTLQ